MKKLLALFVLASFVLVLPLSLVGCGKNGGSSDPNSIIGTWVFEKIEPEEESKDKDVDFDELFFDYTTRVYTFNSNGTGRVVGQHEKGRLDEEFSWEIVEEEGHRFVKTTKDKHDTYYLFENGKLTGISYEKYDQTAGYVYANIIYKKK